MDRSTSLLVCALVIASCDPAPTEVPIQDLGAELAPVVCELYTRCNPFFGVLAGSPANCSAMLEARFEDTELAAVEAAIERGDVIYHPELVDDCLAALRSGGCLVADPFEVCEGVLEGQVPDGGACERNEECGDGSYCAISAACPGTCQARVGSGASCGDPAGCQAGLTCASGTCRAPAGEGAACNGPTGVSCYGLGLACVGDDIDTAGTCQPWAELLDGALGEPCDPRVEDFCDAGLSCAFDGISGTDATFRCVARVAAGAECTIAVPDQCPADQFCADVDLSTLDTTGTCEPLPIAGEPCTPAIPFPRCGEGLVCGSGNTCVVLGRVGATCAEDSACASSFCDAGRCADGTPLACR